MSFSADLESEAADARSLHYKDFPEFETLSHAIELSLHVVNTKDLVSFKNLVSQYDTLVSGALEPQQPAKVNRLTALITTILDKLNKNYQNINEQTKLLNSYLRKCEADHEDSDTIGYLKQKQALLIKLIKSSLSQYQKLQRRYELLNQKSLDTIAEDSHVPQSALESQAQVQISYEPINAEELEQQTLLIQEREREIEHISQDISYINDIYSNLEDIVHEQQFAIDSIEDNILRYNDDVQGAHVELRRAERYQRRSSGRMFCCFFILLGVMGFIILVGIVF